MPVSVLWTKFEIYALKSRPTDFAIYYLEPIIVRLLFSLPWEPNPTYAGNPNLVDLP